MPRIRDILRINAVFAFAFLFTAGIFLSPFPVEGFIGPGTQVPGSGGGAFKLDSSGSIGFGTATAAPSGTFDDNSQGFGYVFTVASTTNPGLAIRNLFSENMYLWSARNFGNLHLYRESSILPGKVLMDITPTGNVGISVFGPNERLEVGGNVKGNAFIGNLSGEVSAGNVTSDVFGSLGLGGSYAFPASLGIATSTKTGLPQSLSVYGNAYISGNVGIGTASPERKFVVGGNVAFRTSGEAASASRGIEFTPTTWDSGSQTIRSWSAGGGLLIDSANTGTSNAGAEIQLYASNSGSGDIIFRGTTYGTAMQDRVTIKGDTGSVGIGTITPAARLHIVKDNYPELRVQNTNATNPSNFSLLAGAGYGDNKSFVIQDNTAGQARVTVNSSGSVGVGTTNPTTARLVVATSTTGATIDVSGGRIINVGTPTAASDATTKSYVDSVIGGGVGTGTSGQTLRHSGTAWVANSVIYNNGTNVGIGTASPSQRLHIYGNLILQSGSQDIGWASNEVLQIGQWDATFSSYSERMRIDTSGNVGINSTIPTQKLDVVGGGAFTLPVTVGTPTATGHAATKSYVDSIVASSGGGAWTISGTNAYFSLAGSVGIGTTSPLGKLHINTGSLRISSSTNQYITAYMDTAGIYIEGYGDTVATNRVRIQNSNRGGLANYNGVIIGENAVGSGEGIQFYTGGYANNRMVINGSGNVGIGTTSPGESLHVNKASGTTLVKTEVAAASIVGFDIKKTGTTNQEWRIVDGQTVNGQLEFYDFTDSRLVMSLKGDGNVIVNNGNVGIGSTTPAQKLDVVGGGAFTQPVIVGTPTATNHAATKSYVDSAATGQSGWTDGGGSVYLTTSGDEVSIGSTVPDAVRQVTLKRGRDTQDYGGSISFYNDNYSSARNFYIGNVYNGVDPMSFRIGRYNATTYADLVSITESGNVGIGIANPSKHLDIYGDATSGEIRFRRELSYYWDVGINANSDFIFKSQTGGEVMRLKYLGNVGIGTSAPTDKLDVFSSSSNQRLIRISHPTAPTQASGYLGFNTDGTISDNVITLGVQYSNIYYDVFNIQRSTRNVGINTTNPAYGLDVNGTGRFSQPVIVGTPTATNHATTKSYVDSVVGGGAGTGSFATLSVTGTSTLAVSTGNVGIGTATPTEKLMIYGSGAQLRFEGGNNRILFGTKRALEANPDGSLLQLGEQYTKTALYGNVGIGTTAPGGKLDLNVSSYGDGYKLSQDGSVKSAWITNSAGSNYDTVFGAVSNNAIRFITGNVVKMVITDHTSGGNVGIGSTSPGYKLDVTGTGQFTQPVIVGTPTASTHAATKSYVDSAAGGGVGAGSSGQTLRHNGTAWVANSVIYNNGTNVGIGTTSATEKLTVNGRIDMGNNTLNQAIIWPNVYDVGTGRTVRNIVLNSDDLLAYAVDRGYTVSASRGPDGGSLTHMFRPTGSASWSGVTSTNPVVITISALPNLSVDRMLIVPNSRNRLPLDYLVETYDIYTGGWVTRKNVTGENTSYIKYIYLGSQEGVQQIRITVTNAGDSDNTGILDISNIVVTSRYQQGRFTGYAVSAAGDTIWGNLAIQKSSASYTLDVVGTGQFTQPVIVGTPTATTHATTKSYVDSMFTGSGQWTTSGSNIYSSLAGNVGIGTTSPSNKLTVGVADSSTTQASGGAVLNIFNSNSTANNYATISFGQSGAGSNSFSRIGVQYIDRTGGSEDQDMFFSTIGAGAYNERMRILSTGNVGIGTTIPSVLFEVDRGTSSGSVAEFSGGGNGGIRIQINNSTDSLGTGEAYRHRIGSQGGSESLAFFANNADRMVISSAGNIGISSATPGYKLDVVGTGSFSQPVIVGTPTATNHAATKSYVDSATVSQTGWTDGGTVVYNTTLTDNVGIGTTGPTGLLTLRYGDTSVNNGMAKPILKLDVHPSGADVNVLEFRAFSSNGRVMQISQNAIGTQGIGANPTITKYSAAYGSNQIVLFAPDAVGEDTTTGGIYFNTTPTSNDTSVSTRMFIRTDGNVGIGTTSPGSPLHVNGAGELATFGDANFDNKYIQIRDDVINGIMFGLTTNSFSGWSGGAGLIKTGSSKGFAISVNNANNFADVATAEFVIDPTGLVGIGTTDPGYKLDVVGTSQFSQPVIVGTPTATNHATTKSYVDSMFTGSGQWTTSGSNIYSTLAGNVGIGTTSPGAKLDVYGGGNNSNGILYVHSSDSGSDGTLIKLSSYSFINQDSSGNGYWSWGHRYDGANNIWVRTYTGAGLAQIKLGYGSSQGFEVLTDTSTTSEPPVLTSRFMVRNDGNVGIGTTVPAYTLDVRGGGTGYFSNPVFVATPTNAGHAATKSYVDSILSGTLSGNFTTLSVTGTSTLSGNWQLGGASLGNINLNGYDIVGVNKITAAVIDPLYEIDGEKYATYGLDTVGLKTEITGRAKLSAQISKSQLSISNQCNNDSIENSMKIANCKLQNFEYAINFSNIERGSDLWVWYQTVVFSPEDLAVLATPYGSLAKIGYRIEGKTIVFFSDEPTEFSYRLSGKRHDSDVWGTKRDTTEKASFILKAK